MSAASIDPVVRQPEDSQQQAARDWLDAVATGACDQNVFLRGIYQLVRDCREAAWEVLPLLDQYHRRGKIGSELFQPLKAYLEGLVLGTRQAAGLTAPLAPVPDAAHKASNTLPVGPPAPAQAPHPNPVRTVIVGDLLRGRYQVTGILGHGGMGTVFEAVDQYRVDLPTTGRGIAIKVLHTAVSEQQELFAELRSEFQNSQLLSHPNIVRVHEFDHDGDIAFFTMELLSGAPLSRVLGARKGVPLNRSHALAIIRGVGAALAHAHSRNVVHGDINPQNIFLTDEGEVRVLDFGASHLLKHGSRNAGPVSPQQPSVATHGYASCQLLEGNTVEPRDDVFAFTCVAYLLLTGKHPFGNRTAIAARTLRLAPRRPAGLNRGQWQAVRAGLHFERDRRPADVGAWLTRLDPRAAAYRIPQWPTLLTPPPRHRKAALLAALCALIALWAPLGSWRPTRHDSIAPSKDPGTAAIDSPRARAAAPSPAPTAGPNPAPTAGPNPAPTAGPPSAGTVIVGRARVELAADTVLVSPSERWARVSVHRKGTLRGEVSFTWWTESGTAKPEQDFAAFTPRVEHIEDGKNSVSLLIPVVSNSTRREPKSFYVVIDAATPKTLLGARTLTMVTIDASQ